MQGLTQCGPWNKLSKGWHRISLFVPCTKYRLTHAVPIMTWNAELPPTTLGDYITKGTSRSHRFQSLFVTSKCCSLWLYLFIIQVSYQRSAYQLSGLSVIPDHQSRETSQAHTFLTWNDNYSEAITVNHDMQPLTTQQGYTPLQLITSTWPVFDSFLESY